MKLLLDMNLSPTWVPYLAAQGWEVVHGSAAGPAGASDGEIMRWAKERGYCVVTHGLDFSAILAATQATGPSVVQIRAQNLSPEALGPTLVTVLEQHRTLVSEGAILTLDLRTARVRSLPMH